MISKKEENGRKRTKSIRRIQGRVGEEKRFREREKKEEEKERELCLLLWMLMLRLMLMLLKFMDVFMGLVREE